MSKARRKFTQFLLLAVSAVGLLSALLLLTDPPPAELSGVSEIFTANSAIMASSHRNIASIDPKQTRVPETALLEINCTEVNQMLETTSPRFRLKGPICVPQDLTVTSTKVMNKSNGYIATVFHQSALFTTDYINLSEGRNEIDVQFDTEKGAIKKTITVIRSVATAAQN